MNANLAASVDRPAPPGDLATLETGRARVTAGFQRGSNGTWLPSITIAPQDGPHVVYTAGRCHASVSARLALECAREMANDWQALLRAEPLAVCKWLSGR